MTTYRRHTVTPGKSLFTPRPSFCPFKAERVVVVLALHDTAWWSAEEWENDKDRFDWNKGPGITAAFSLNNINAAFLGWRPDFTRPGWFEVCAYVNDEQGNFEWSKVLPLQADQDAATLTIDVSDKYTIDCKLTAGAEEVQTTFAWRRPWYGRFRWSGLSIGGGNNSPGPYGGKAHKWMDLSAAYEKLSNGIDTSH